MNRTLHHRGPDEDGVFLAPSGKAALAHKRLSIIDLTNGKQPMTDPGGRFTLVFNGEIYNHHELRQELLRKGHPIRTRSDTEVLLFAFMEYGAEECCRRLRGMFAFAVHDNRDGTLHLCRDRLGIKPLYYGRAGRNLVFASECKAILAYPGFDRSLDVEAVSDFFSLMYIPAPKSAYKAIRKLPAGHWMRVAPDGRETLGKYWDLEFTDAPEGSEEDFRKAEEALLAELDAAVGSHMESDVPLGAFLSGGVDSAAVVAMMSRRSSSPIRTNTIGFDDSRYDESAAARETAAHFHTEHSEFQVKADALKTMDKLAWHFDEPFADPSMIPTYHVCEMTRKRVTVCLSGDGGDENFAGYRRYYFDRLENRLRGLLPAPVRRPVFGALGALYPKADWLPRPLRAKTLLRNLSYPPARGYFTSMSHFHPGMKQRLFSPDLQRQLGGYDTLSVFEQHWNACRSKDPLSRAQYVDVKTYLPEDILAKVDRASMAVSLEVRVPLLDHKFMEFAASLPPGWKLRGKDGKHIFKQSLKKALPGSIFTRPKTGFSPPLSGWLRGELKEMGRELLLGREGLGATGLFQQPYLESLWRAHQGGLADHEYPLFALISFGFWHRKFIRETV